MTSAEEEGESSVVMATRKLTHINSVCFWNTCTLKVMANLLSEESSRRSKFKKNVGIHVELGAYMELHALRVIEEIARLCLRPGQ